MKIGTIKGENIIAIWVVGEEQGDIKAVYSLRDSYELIKDLKKQDKLNNIEDKYTLTLETENDYYYGYTIRKYRNRFIVK